MKCTKDNVEKVFQTLLSQLEDENGRGEFDDESDLLTSVEHVIEWFNDDYALISRCEKCNKYFKDEELTFVKDHGVICTNCKVEE